MMQNTYNINIPYFDKDHYNKYFLDNPSLYLFTKNNFMYTLVTMPKYDNSTHTTQNTDGIIIKTNITKHMRTHYIWNMSCNNVSMQFSAMIVGNDTTYIATIYQDNIPYNAIIDNIFAIKMCNYNKIKFHVKNIGHTICVLIMYSNENNENSDDVESKEIIFDKNTSYHFSKITLYDVLNDIIMDLDSNIHLCDIKTLKNMIMHNQHFFREVYEKITIKKKIEYDTKNKKIAIYDVPNNLYSFAKSHYDAEIDEILKLECVKDECRILTLQYEEYFNKYYHLLLTNNNSSIIRKKIKYCDNGNNDSEYILCFEYNNIFDSTIKNCEISIHTNDTIYYVFINVTFDTFAKLTTNKLLSITHDNNKMILSMNDNRNIIKNILKNNTLQITCFGYMYTITFTDKNNY